MAALCRGWQHCCGVRVGRGRWVQAAAGVLGRIARNARQPAGCWGWCGRRLCGSAAGACGWAKPSETSPCGCGTVLCGGQHSVATLQERPRALQPARVLRLHLLPTQSSIRCRIMQNAGKGLDPMELHKGAPPPTGPACRWIGDRGLRVVTGERTLERLAALSTYTFTELDDMVPADGSLLLILRPGAHVSAQLWAALAAPLPGALAAVESCHEIAVEYGGAAGPDLAALAERAGMDRATYINSHAAVEYTVAFLGFQPGFPYLRRLPDALRVPRRATPRARVAAGSVAIGGGYCGIYPTGGPGGWQIIGRTATVLFDPARAVPALLTPGDRVRFVPR